jgi:hypothetical protein
MPIAWMETMAKKLSNRAQLIHASPPKYKQTTLNKFVQAVVLARKTKFSTPSPKKRVRSRARRAQYPTYTAPTLARDPTPLRYTVARDPIDVMLTMNSTVTAPVLCVNYPWSRLLVMGLKTGEIRNYVTSASCCSVLPGRMCWIMETKGLVKEDQVMSHIANGTLEDGDRVGTPTTSQHVVGAVVFDENTVKIESKEHMMTLAKHHMISDSSSWFPEKYPVYMWKTSKAYVLLRSWKFTPNNAQGSRRALAVEGLLEDCSDAIGL